MNGSSLIPWTWGGLKPILGEGYDPFTNMRRELDRVFEDFTRGFGVPAREGEALLAPRIDVAETDKDIEVTVELPGLEEKDVEVTMVDDLLTIRGEKKREKEEKGKDYQLVERSYGSFIRQLRLPFDADSSKVSATFKNGVLTVKVGKPKEVQAKTVKIPIKAAA
jgi:HSP20 family protein